MTEESPSPKTFFIVYAALLVLLLATFLVADLASVGWGNTLVAVTIACAKAALVALFFMNLRHSSRYNAVFFCAGAFWLAILFVLSMNDFLTRGWIPMDAAPPAGFGPGR